MRDLWSKHDERACAALMEAAARGDLVGALLAVEGVEGEAAAEARRSLRSWGCRVESRVAGATCPEVQHQALRDVLAEDLGFHGDRERYYQAANSHLTQVLGRREGLPILLSSIWMVVGQSAGLTVDGIGLPGHFVVRVGGGDGVLVDPFERGRRLTRCDCQRLVSEMAGQCLDWQDAWLIPVSLERLVERVLRNLVSAYGRANDGASLYRTVRMLAEFRPQDPEALLLHARLSEELGALGTAEPLYRRVCDEFAGSRAAGVAGERLRNLRCGDRLLN